MINIGIPSLKNIISKFYNWFSEENTPEKYEVISTSYFIQTEDTGKQKVKKKKLTRMRVLKRKKEANNGV